jgi:hypothetical protein
MRTPVRHAVSVGQTSLDCHVSRDPDGPPLLLLT